MRRESSYVDQLRLRGRADAQDIPVAPLRRVVDAFLERTLEVRH